MADRRPNRPPVKFREGCMIFGNTTLGHSSVKFRPRRRQQAQPEPTEVLEDAEEAPKVTPDAPLEIDPDVLYRAHQVFMILTSSGVVAPAGTPEQGKILREEAIVQFVARHRRLAELRGFTAALPKIVFHWTQERNFASIAREGLRVPDGAGVAIAHGSSFGNGIYVSPEFRYGKELFAYGARAAFMCLALPGKQHFGKPPADGTGFLSPEDDGYDSVIGREGQRGIDEWVFFRQDQLLLCFLVDELGLVMAKEAAFAAIKVLHQPWPQPPAEISQLPAPVQEIQAGRWQRRHAPDAGAPTDEAGMGLVSESYRDTNATKARC
ncbi:nipblb [Symbiodinium sp. CCMP2592]|nr:nipblb [Symbiodinium sp. CCMP2592]